MLYIYIIQLLSTSVNTRIHLAILYSKSLIASLFILSFLSYNTLYLDNLNKPIDIFGGLFHISTLNTWFNLIGIGYTLYTYTYNQDSEKEKLVEKTSHNKANRGPKNNKEINNSPIQLIDQLKGYFYVNSFLSISLAITLFSFAGIPPLIGFFAKLMVLSASIDNGYVFMSIIAILTSVIGGVYYLLTISKIFFESSIYSINTHVKRLLLSMVNTKSSNSVKSIALSSALTIIISILTSIILLFIFIPSECLNFLLILSMIFIRY